MSEFAKVIPLHKEITPEMRASFIQELADAELRVKVLREWLGYRAIGLDEDTIS